MERMERRDVYSSRSTALHSCTGVSGDPQPPPLSPTTSLSTAEPKQRTKPPTQTAGYRSVAAVRVGRPGRALSTPLAAAYVGLSPATLETLRVRGGGPTFVKLGRRVVYRREDLDTWLEAARRASTSEEGRP